MVSYSGVRMRPFVQKYRDQMPVRSIWTPDRIINSLASVVSLASVYFILWAPTEWSEAQKWIVAGALAVIAILSFAGPFLPSVLVKPHRYAQTVYYTHYVNHIVRDCVSSIQRDDRDVSPRDTVVEVANAVAACFSMLTGRRCRCCIKEVRPDNTIQTVARDAASNIAVRKKTIHTLDGNTDFADVWYGRNGCLRYFWSNNLIKKFKDRQYSNTSFEIHGLPEIKSFGVFSVVTKWYLPYRAAIVWPIRALRSRDWPPEDVGQNHNEDQIAGIWGFLCIDCNSRYAFDNRYAPELGAAFADALYTLFTVADKEHKKT